MIALLAPRPSARRAADILREVFGHIPAPFAFRLWDGTEVPIGEGEPAFAAVIKSPETFTRLIRDPTPLNFAEAYVESAIDVEGDLFRAMTVADAIEELRLSLRQRLRILLSLYRG
jgi:cyclopropane-fatty-acyl-phospholipid synthase